MIRADDMFDEFRRTDPDFAYAEAKVFDRTGHDYGWSWRKLLWWRYDLVKGAAFVGARGYELRWYGVTIPRTNIGVGLMIRRPAKEA